MQIPHSSFNLKNHLCKNKPTPIRYLHHLPINIKRGYKIQISSSPSSCLVTHYNLYATFTINLNSTYRTLKVLFLPVPFSRGPWVTTYNQLLMQYSNRSSPLLPTVSFPLEYYYYNKSIEYACRRVSSLD